MAANISTRGRPVPARLWRALGAALFLMSVFMVGGLSLAAQGAGPDIALSAAERAWLDEYATKLTLYADPAFPPFEFSDKDGRVTGMGPDVIERIESILGVRFSRYAPEDWDDVLEALRSGECFVNSAMTKTRERSEYAFFTTPFTRTPASIISTQDRPGRLGLEDLAGKAVGIVSSYAIEQDMRDQALVHGFGIVAFRDVESALIALLKGDIDAYVENMAVASYYIELMGITNLHIAGETELYYTLSIAVSRKYPLLFGAIQKALQSIPESELAQIRKRWVALHGYTALSPEARLALRLGAGFGVLLIASVSGIALFLKLRLRQKVQALDRSQKQYRRLADNSPAVVFQCRRDPQGIVSFTFLSEALTRTVGVEPKEGIADARTILGRMHPEDEESFYRGLCESAEELIPFDAMFRLDKGDGHIWIEARSSPERQDDGGTLWDGFFIDISERKAAEEAIRKRLEEKEVLLREIHHRVRNNLAVLASLVNLQSSELTSQEDAVTAFAKMRDRINAMAIVHQAISESDDFSGIDMRSYIEELLRQLSGYAPAGGVDLEIDTTDIRMGMDAAVPLGLIISELVGNALEHAFPDGRGGTVTVRLNEERGIALLEVGDDGVGGNEGKPGFGLTLVRILAEQLHGVLDLRLGRGRSYALSFPMAAVSKPRSPGTPKADAKVG